MHCSLSRSRSSLPGMLLLSIASLALPATGSAQGVLSGAGIPAAPHAESLSPRQVYLQTLKSVCWISVEDGFGTGWILDVDQRLVVTNHHVVDGFEEMQIYFPIYVNGKLDSNINHYSRTSVRATVIDSIESLDLAIVQVDSLPADSRPLTLAADSAGAGERVHAIGGHPRGSAGLWEYSSGFVTLVTDEPSIDVSFRVMQSNIDVHQGNSGGAIVNDHGQLVGVVQSGNMETGTAYNIDVTVVRDYLAEIRPLINSSSANDLVRMGQRHRAAGRPRVAMRYFSRALQASPNLALAMAERGWAFIEIGDSTTAMKDFDAALGINRALTSAWEGRAQIYRSQGDYTKAASDYSMAIAGEPDNDVLYRSRGLMFEYDGAYDKAYDDYSQAIRLKRSATNVAYRGDLLIKMQRYRQAQRELTEAVQIWDGYAWAYSRLAWAYCRDQKFEPAEESIWKAIEASDEELRYVVDLGEIVQRASNHEKGVQVWSIIIKRDSDNGYNYYSRAWSLRRLERHQEAIADLDRAIELDSADARFHYERGLCYRALGQGSAAHRDFARAAEIDPDNYPLESNRSQANNSPVVGKWHFAQYVGTMHMDATQWYHSNGQYESVVVVRQNDGSTRTIREQGNYEVRDGRIAYDTNLGQFELPYKFKSGMLYQYFTQQQVWIGSVKKS